MSPIIPGENLRPFSCRAGLLSPEEFRAKPAPRGTHHRWLRRRRKGRGAVSCPRPAHTAPRVSLPARSPDGLGFGGAQAPLLSLPLPEITPYEAMGLAGLGLPGDECLPTYWTPRRSEGPSLPDVRPCLRGNPPRVRVPGQRGACPSGAQSSGPGG